MAGPAGASPIPPAMNSLRAIATAAMDPSSPTPAALGAPGAAAPPPVPTVRTRPADPQAAALGVRATTEIRTARRRQGVDRMKAMATTRMIPTKSAARRWAARIARDRRAVTTTSLTTTRRAAPATRPRAPTISPREHAARVPPRRDITRVAPPAPQEAISATPDPRMSSLTQRWSIWKERETRGAPPLAMTIRLRARQGGIRLTGIHPLIRDLWKHTI
mmetsp:Transcript_26856/g.48711  ORF Transcript_26856/g.48711 Transcript_26856/m.48711 type:complete len:219 (+) Transcript_26856:297-953(+)